MLKINKEEKLLVESKLQCIDSKYLRKYPKFIEYIERSSKKKLPEESKLEVIKIQDISNMRTRLQELEEAYMEIKESLRDELLEKLKQVDFYRFENIVVDFIIRMGYGGSKSEAKRSLTKKG